MHLVALTGGIASGKSTVAQRWREQGAVVVDADALAREVVAAGSPVLREISQRFGAEMVSDDGTLNRSALGALIFGDSNARETLNGITHPAISRLARERFDEAESRDPAAIIVYDIPLLVESGQTLERFKFVVTVEAERDVRVQRLIDHRGMARNEAEDRVASQATSRERRAVADFVIDANASLAETQHRADDVWSAITDRLHPRL
jgi:dephospho-CoA kinase